MMLNGMWVVLQESQEECSQSATLPIALPLVMVDWAEYSTGGTRKYIEMFT